VLWDAAHVLTVPGSLLLLLVVATVLATYVIFTPARRKLAALEAATVSQRSGDPHRLEQVIDNLATNALRHMPEGGTLAVDARAVDGGMCLSVTDSGAGIGSARPQRRGRGPGAWMRWGETPPGGAREAAWRRP